jgi:glycosyltransferase involved in cell wall biosynthesis
MQLLLQGAAKAARHLDVLLLVAPDIIENVDPSDVEASLEKDWGVSATVTFGARSPEPNGTVWPFLPSLFDYRAQPFFRRSSTDAQVAEVASAIRDDTDLIFIHRLDAADACVRASAGRVPVAMNLDTIEHIEMERRLAVDEHPRSLVHLIERARLPALRSGERRVFESCSMLLVCSETERDYLRAQGMHATALVIPNARDFVDGRETLAPDRPGDTLMFFGSYGYPPNAQAAEELIDRIFPLVRARRPDARLLIAGHLVETLPSFGQGKPGVELIPRVDDVAEAYTRADVVCCPIRAGGGTRIKIIEACAWKKPIVSTRIGAEGLDLVDGVEILLRDGVDDMADACIRLLDDRRVARAMGEAAFAKARLTYDRARVVDRIAAALEAPGVRADRLAVA